LRYALGEAFARVYDQLKEMPVPRDYFWKLGDNYWKLKRNTLELSFAAIIALFLIYLVLGSLFESFMHPFSVGLSVVPAFLGAALALKLVGQSLNVGAWMGLIFLAGIVVNNGIILVDEINRLRAKGNDTVRSVVRGAFSRLRPIAMTSCTTILGLLPMALSRTEESALWSPMAMVAIGGLLLSTVLIPLIGPALYLVVEDVRSLRKRL